MIEGYYDNDGNFYKPQLGMDEFKCPRMDRHHTCQISKIPTVTGIYELDKKCQKKIWLDYNKWFYRHHNDFYLMIRGNKQHKSFRDWSYYKELMLSVRIGDNILVGFPDDYDPGIGRIFELKSVSSFPDNPRPKDAYQVLTYAWMIQKNGLSAVDVEIHYEGWWKKDYPQAIFIENLFHYLEIQVKDFDELANYIYEQKMTFSRIMSTDPKNLKISLKDCPECPYWNLCSQGKKESILNFKKTKKLPMNNPAWFPDQIKEKMSGDEGYRHNWLVQTLAIIEG